MKKGTSLKLILIAAIGTAIGIGLSTLLNGEIAALIGSVAVTLIACGVVMYFNSTGFISKSEQLKDSRDYRDALMAWLREGTPFNDLIRVAITHLDSLDRKQKALRNILNDSNDSPFLTTADDVEHYVLSNTKRLLNRIMIFDGTDRNKLDMHMTYLKQLLQQDAKVLSDFENLIVEVSQIGDDAQVDVPVLKELTEALHSVRDTGDEEVWEQLDAQNNAEIPITQSMDALNQLRTQPQYHQPENQQAPQHAYGQQTFPKPNTLPSLYESSLPEDDSQHQNRQQMM